MSRSRRLLRGHFMLEMLFRCGNLTLQVSHVRDCRRAIVLLHLFAHNFLVAKRTAQSRVRALGFVLRLLITRSQPAFVQRILFLQTISLRSLSGDDSGSKCASYLARVIFSPHGSQTAERCGQ
jgi:hypothetical protein